MKDRKEIDVVLYDLQDNRCSGVFTLELKHGKILSSSFFTLDAKMRECMRYSSLNDHRASGHSHPHGFK